MTVTEQAKVNILDSHWMSIFGAALFVGGILCKAGVLALYLSDPASHAWCSAIEDAAVFVGGPAMVFSRSPLTPPRD